MSDAEHTPGPWEYGSKDDGFQTSSLCTIWNVPRLPTEDGLGQSYAYVSADRACFKISESEREANGRLMAAAPDLLSAADEALNVLIGCTVSAGGCDDARHIQEAKTALRKAIAKAEGRS